jgi:hypothetical protein
MASASMDSDETPAVAEILTLEISIAYRKKVFHSTMQRCVLSSHILIVPVDLTMRGSE